MRYCLSTHSCCIYMYLYYLSHCLSIISFSEIFKPCRCLLCSCKAHIVRISYLLEDFFHFENDTLHQMRPTTKQMLLSHFKLFISLFLGLSAKHKRQFQKQNWTIWGLHCKSCHKTFPSYEPFIAIHFLVSQRAGNERKRVELSLLSLKKTRVYNGDYVIGLKQCTALLNTAANALIRLKMAFSCFLMCANKHTCMFRDIHVPCI